MLAAPRGNDAGAEFGEKRLATSCHGEGELSPATTLSCSGVGGNGGLPAPVARAVEGFIRVCSFMSVRCGCNKNGDEPKHGLCGSYTLLWGFKMTSTQHAEKEKGRNKVCRTPLHVLLPRCAHLLAGVATPSSQAGSTAKLTVRALPRDRCRSRRLPCTPMS